MTRRRGGVLVSLGALTIACFVVIGASAASSPKKAKSKFTKQDRAALARQEARGVHLVSLLIATPREGTKSVAKSVRALGGTVAYRNDRLGYMRFACRSPRPTRLRG
jgi:sugar/nucleoside kinase (ribokinase family)